MFYPRPKVDSALVRLERREEGPRASDYAIFQELVRAAFSNRRKKLKNATSAVEIGDIEFVSQEPSFARYADKRAEELTMEDYVKIANLLAEGN